MKSNRSSNYRYKWFWVEFCGDGMYYEPRIKGRNKKRLGKKSRKEFQKQYMPISED